MRLWSLKHSYLDTKGLLAVWREGLLAKKVLEGKTKGYKNHPQLERFKKLKDPIVGINTYLYYVYLESVSRDYYFSKDKINHNLVNKDIKIPLNDKQLEYEFELLKTKLKLRDNKCYEKIKDVKIPEYVQIFELKKGPIENWEKIKKI
ncbi:MAG: pyrimidine dimer DNA glycosylase/endonuclease V [Candidatus Micrarchaeaceae archaeon]